MIKEIPYNVAKEWCLKYHYAKRVPSISYSFGWYDEELLAVLTIGKPASPFLCRGICGHQYSKYVYELNRLISKPNINIPLSQFVGQALKQLPNMILVSYADTEWNHVGIIYQATNWLYTGATKARTDIDSPTHSRHYAKDTDYSKRKYRSSKHRYVMFTGDKRFKKQARQNLNYPSFPYPKADKAMYNIDWGV